MPNPLLGITAAVGIGGSILSSGSQARAAEGATAAQVQSNEEAIAAAERADERAIEILRPFSEVATGVPGVDGEPGITGSLQATQALLGLLGDEEQANAIASIESGAEFQDLTRQGEEAILANASATGGLRGGNVQGALGQFRPALLQNLIGQRLDRLGGLTQIGQASAARTGAQGLQTAQNVGGFLQNIGTAQAGGALARGQAQTDLFSGIARGIGTIAGGF